MYHISMFTFRIVCGKFWPCPLLLLLKAVDTAAKILSVHSNIFWTGHHQVGQLEVPGSPPSAMPCFSCLPGGRETLDKMKDSIKQTVKRRLSCISTCFPGMDQSHRWWMIQHRFPVTFTKAFYVPRSKPKVRSRGSIFPIADKMETLCCTSPK